MNKRIIIAILSIITMFVASVGNTVFADKLENYTEKKGIKIESFGHSSFGISDKDGMKIVTDPYVEGMGYNFPKISTEILTVSHYHFDHGYVEALKSYNNLIDTAGLTNIGNIEVKGISSYHDNANGTLRGENTIFTYEINKIKICHLGDLGHELTQDLIDSIGEIDVLMIPVGGTFTINYDEAVKAVEQLNPKIVIPMHYKTDDLDPDFAAYLDPVDNFVEKMNGWEIEKADSITLTKQALNTQKGNKIVILSYK